MKVVWKHRLALEAAPQKFVMLGRAKFVHVDQQDGKPTLWYLVDPETPVREERIFQVFGTGDESVPDDATYLGTIKHGWFVGHIFELPVPDEG